MNDPPSSEPPSTKSSESYGSSRSTCPSHAGLETWETWETRTTWKTPLGFAFHRDNAVNPASLRQEIDRLDLTRPEARRLCRHDVLRQQR